MSTTTSQRLWVFRKGPLLTLAAVLGLGFILFSYFRSPPSLVDGVTAFHNGQIDRARKIAQQRISHDPREAAAWHLLGQCEESAGDRSAATQAYREAATHSPNHGKSRFKFAMSLLESGRLEEAEQEFLKLYQDQPADESVRTELQWLFFNQLRERELEQLLEDALKRQPNDFQAAFHLLYAAQRHPVAQEAKGLLERANQMVPGQATVELALGRCYWKLAQAALARPLIEAANRKLNHLESHLVFAEFLLEQGEWDEADAQLKPPQQSEELWKLDDRWRWLQSRRRFEQQRLPEALEQIEQAIRLRPSEVRYVQFQATILQALKRAADAAKAREQAARLIKAEQELYIIVSRGDLEHPTPAIMQQVARRCRESGRSVQAQAWEHLAQTYSPAH